MQVKVNYEVADKFIEIINHKKYIDYKVFIEAMKKLESLAGMKVMLGFYKHTYSFREYCDILYQALNRLEFDSNNQEHNLLYTNLKRIIDNEDKLHKKMRLIKNYDFNKLEDQLKCKLPDNTDIDVDIFFAFDALNGGTVIGNKIMLLNTMFWPSEETHLNLIEGVLLHEYHHIGLKYWIEQKYRNFESYHDSLGLIRLLIISIMGEGAATYFYNDGDDLYPLALESHGEEIADALRSSMTNRSDNINSYLQEFEDDINYLASFSGDVSELKTLRSKYAYSSTSEPLDKAIGYHVCEQIDANLGTAKLIECFKSPEIFMQSYHESLSKPSEFALSEQVLEIIKKAFA